MCVSCGGAHGGAAWQSVGEGCRKSGEGRGVGASEGVCGARCLHGMHGMHDTHGVHGMPNGDSASASVFSSARGNGGSGFNGTAKGGSVVGTAAWLVQAVRSGSSKMGRSGVKGKGLLSSSSKEKFVRGGRASGGGGGRGRNEEEAGVWSGRGLKGMRGFWLFKRGKKSDGGEVTGDVEAPAAAGAALPRAAAMVRSRIEVREVCWVV